MKMGERLKSLRENKELTQKQLADIIGVSDRVYAYYEQDIFPKDEGILLSLAKALGTTVSFLLGEDTIDDPKFTVLARSAEALSKDDKDQLYQIFEATLNSFLNKGKQSEK